jgi:para-nitrobenzyl esterase
MNKILMLGLALIPVIGYAGSPEASRSDQSRLKGEITASASEAIVKTESGLVSGYIEDGIYTYKGIPYAQAERFMPPTKVKPWDGVRSSRAYGPTCPQKKRAGWLVDEMAFESRWDDGFPGEDCLRVNIWTKGINDGKKRPVMVWLHGGGYSAGSGQELPAYDGANLSKKGDVVLVSLNHRLNVLGFLDLSAFGDKYARSGNVGLLDLIAALQWVKNDIANFGGDPSNVTIFGQSGGGGKVTTLLTCRLATGLFHKAIVESGSMLQMMDSKYSKRIGVTVMEELGLNASQIDQLKDIPYEKLLDAGEKAIAKVKAGATTEGLMSLLFGWGPTVDGDILTLQPSSSQAYEPSGKIPVIIGTTLHEFMGSSRNPALKKATMERAKVELAKQYGDKTDEFLKAFGKAYPDFKPVDLFDVDMMFRPQAVQQATFKANSSNAPVYMYLFAWESPILDGAFRASHCMELPFVFDNIYNSRTMTGGGEAAYALADKMSSAWINFATTGNPNTAGLPDWKPFDPQKGATMIFNNQCEIKYNHDKELLNIVNSHR